MHLGMPVCTQLTADLPSISTLAPNCNNLPNPTRDPPVSLMAACIGRIAHHGTAQLLSQSPCSRHGRSPRGDCHRFQPGPRAGLAPCHHAAVPLSLEPCAGFPKTWMPGDWQPAAPPDGGKRSLTEPDEPRGLQLSVQLMKITQ